MERMVICYHAPPLAYRHLHETSSLLSYVVPELEPRSALESAVQIHLGLSRFARNQVADRLLEIIESGGAEQQSEFDRIVMNLRELVRPCLELDVFWRSNE